MAGPISVVAVATPKNYTKGEGMFPKKVGPKELHMNIARNDDDLRETIAYLKKEEKRLWWHMPSRPWRSWRLLWQQNRLEQDRGPHDMETRRVYHRRREGLVVLQVQYEDVQRERRFLQTLLKARQTQTDRGDWQPDDVA